MADWRDLREVIEAAEQAAAAGDYASAEQLLREAAVLQENSLGPTHPNLANILNNLGVVCEIREKPVEAETFFRRAYAIATAILEPDHPFVLTSRKNLEDFCEARGMAVDAPSAPSAADDAVATGSDEPPPELPLYGESRPVVTKGWSPSPAVGALIAVALFLGFIVTAAWIRSNDAVTSPTETSGVSSKTRPTSAKSPRVKAASPDAPNVSTTNSSVPGRVAPKAGVKTSTPPPDERVREAVSPPTASAKSPTTTAKSPNAAPKSVGTTASVLQPPVVAVAELCRSLSTSNWQCVRPGKSVGAGSLFFYTRLKSPAVTAVQHRWYRGDRLHRVVNLPVRVNTTDGYRTYSRTTVDNKGGGDWRVELRTRDGVVLHEERFLVR